MAAEQLHHLALPMLYGAPAYARPTVTVAQVERPFDPDAFPLQAVLTDEERELLARGPALQQVPAEDEGARISPRLFSLQSLTERLRDLTG